MEALISGLFYLVQFLERTSLSGSIDPSLSEEIHQVQEDKARTVLQEVLKEKTALVPDPQARDSHLCTFTAAKKAVVFVGGLCYYEFVILYVKITGKIGYFGLHCGQVMHKNLCTCVCMYCICTVQFLLKSGQNSPN
jgi:hypothetical protein